MTTPVRVRRASFLVNAFSLMLTTIVTAAAGLVFWAIAGRLLPVSAVGDASAEISTALLLSKVSQLSLGTILPRFLPVAGPRSRRLVALGYAATAALSVVVASGFVAVGWGSGFLHGGAEIATFILAVPILTVFALQDAALTALRESFWVMVENAATAGLRLAAVPLLCATAATDPLVLAYLLPALAAVLAVNAVLFWRILPAHERASGGTHELPARRPAAGFVVAEYANSLIESAGSLLLPLVVLSVLGSTQSAYFYLPWLVGTTAMGVLFSVALSFGVHAAADPAALRGLLLRTLRILAVLSIGGAAAGIVLAPFLLRLVGPEYADNGTTLFRLIMLGIPFVTIEVVYSTFVWLERRVWLLVVIQLVTTGALLGLTAVLIEPWGINGVGVAFLSTTIASGLACLPPTAIRVRRILDGRGLRAPAGSPVAAEVR